jgi:uncharacterized membrane protein YeaQ/YmgE (transglycosylase-associated protein family)
MSILVFLVFGFVVGLIARAVVPGTQSMGIIGTTALGAAGSFVGGLIGSLLFGSGPWNEIHTSGLIGSVIGAVAVMFAVGALGSRTAAA